MLWVINLNYGFIVHRLQFIYMFNIFQDLQLIKLYNRKKILLGWIPTSDKIRHHAKLHIVAMTKKNINYVWFLRHVKK